MFTPNITLVACGAPLAARVHEVAAAVVQAGWGCVVVASPMGAQWVDARAVETITGLPPSVEQRPITAARRGRLPDAVIAAPITFNTLNKIATGISDTYAAGVLCEAVSLSIPLVLVPMISTRLWGHPAVEQSISALNRWGACFLDLNSTDGPTATPQPVPSGTGDQLVAEFNPQRVVDTVRRSGMPAT